jgi:hypothetical protein
VSKWTPPGRRHGFVPGLISQQILMPVGVSKTIADLANVAYYDQSSMVGGASITTWSNLASTGSGYDLTVSAAPPYSAALFGARGGVTLNGTTHSFLENNSTLVISHALWMDANVAAWMALGFRSTNAAQNNATIMGSSSGTVAWRTAFTNVSPYQRYRCVRNNGTTSHAKEYTETVGTAASRVIDTYEPGAHRLYVNGVAGAGDPEVWNNAYSTGSIRFALGRLGSSASGYCAMEVACCAVGTGALSSSDVAVLDAWIQSRTG